jgi:hypothetical protein
MFTAIELGRIVTALQMAAKSAQRLANREGQPETVAAEYRRVLADDSVLVRKAQMELDKLKAGAAPKK